MIEVEEAVDQLIGMGYLKYTPESEHGAARREMMDSLSRGYLDTKWDSTCVSRDRRSYSADSEDLAEGQIRELLRSMKEVLQAEGVRLDAVKDHFEEDRYELLINGRPYSIYDSRIADLAGSWDIATRRTLEIVNELLIAAGSCERLYGIYGGNDGRVILLTEEMHNLLKAPDLKIDPRWLPYPPTAIPDAASFAKQRQAWPMPRWKRYVFTGFFLVLFIVGCVSLLLKALRAL
jgi:hypothetical protein